jgi:hypothetical protein
MDSRATGHETTEPWPAGSPGRAGWVRPCRSARYEAPGVGGSGKGGDGSGVGSGTGCGMGGSEGTGEGSGTVTG